MRNEITFPGRVKKIGNAYYIPLYINIVRALDVGPGSEIDVNIKVVSRTELEESKN